MDKPTLLSIEAAFSLFLILLALWLFKPWQSVKNPALREFTRFERLLTGYGLQREKGEAPRHFALRAARALPSEAALIEDFIDGFEAQQYAEKSLDSRPLKLILKKLRRTLPRPRRKINVQAMTALTRN